MRSAECGVRSEDGIGPGATGQASASELARVGVQKFLIDEEPECRGGCSAAESPGWPAGSARFLVIRKPFGSLLLSPDRLLLRIFISDLPINGIEQISSEKQILLLSLVLFL